MFEKNELSLIKVAPRALGVESYDLDLLLSNRFKSIIPKHAATLKLQIDIDVTTNIDVTIVIEGKPMAGEHMVGKEVVSAIFVPIKQAREHLILLITRLIQSWELLAEPIQVKEVLKEKLG